MRSAERMLMAIRARGSRGLPLERAYRLLYNRERYLVADGRIARNAGAMTRGSTSETVDGMTLAKIDASIAALRQERYRWRPARRVDIATKGANKQRPLGLPTWSDKLLQEVLRLILEAYYAPQFSDHAHGFRPGRGCHTALRTIQRAWTGTAWCIEGDIKGCFAGIGHAELLAILAERIHDGRFLRLIAALPQAGYREDWTDHATLSGSPQGGVVSPILSNIYLDRLDQFVANTLLPRYNRKAARRLNPAYNHVSGRAKYLAKTGRTVEAARRRKLRRTLPSVDPHDPEYRRLRSVRYADDWLLGFCGPRAEAEAIKRNLKTFLRDTLTLERSETKTLITHARTQAARFLGYEVAVLQHDHLCDRTGRRATNGSVGLKVPADVVHAHCRHYQRHGKPAHRTERLFDTDFSILAQYQQEFRGLVEYYRLADNLAPRFRRLKYVMEQSLTKTLARKYRTSVPAIYDRYQALLATPNGPCKGLRVSVEREGKRLLVAEWGGIALRRRPDAVLDERPPRVWNARTELVTRLLADTCELCGSTDGVQVHHIRRLADLRQKGRAPSPAWVQKMASRHRKTLVVCHRCHTAIHAGRVDGSHATNGSH